jgi:glucosamine--fructose-6-phosphate aminotransferase (isomerizing)
MCGIIGILSKYNINIFEYIINSLVQLQNRGYDSSGICLFNENNFILHKYASTKDEDSIEKLKNIDFNQYNTNIGIGHNRWATHGPKNDINSHPHISNNTNIVVVHNGIIENYKKLKEFLISKSFKFYSDTDTEIIANLLEYYSTDENNFTDAIKKTIDNLNGTYGLIILNKFENNRMYCVRNGSPLLLGYNEEYAMITSEQSGFCNKLHSYITLQNDDICYIELINNKIEVKYNYVYDLKNVNLIDFDKNPEPYEHWTIKEIYEQPQKIMNAINNGGRILNKTNVKLGGCDDNIENLEDVENIILLGCGTSYHSCMYGKHFLKKLCNFNLIQIHDGADFEEDDIPKRGKSLMVFVSQSGETKDLHRCIEIAKNKNIFTLGIINVVDSLIAREVDCGIYCNAGREMGVASTKAFTTQVVCLCLLSCWYSQIQKLNENIRVQIIKDLQNLSLDFQNCLNIAHTQINNVLNIIDKSNNLFILGKNTDESIAREGSLKIKEISYIHSEAYSSSSLKHGPFALLDENMPVILLNNNFLYEPKVINAYEEILSRKSPIIFITNNKDIKYPNSIYIPNNKSFSSLLGIIPLQLIAYYLSIKRGINPDKPKNLAKVVTVE